MRRTECEQAKHMNKQQARTLRRALNSSGQPITFCQASAAICEVPCLRSESLGGQIQVWLRSADTVLVSTFRVPQGRVA